MEMAMTSRLIHFFDLISLLPWMMTMNDVLIDQEALMAPVWTPPAPADVDFTKPVTAYNHAVTPYKVKWRS